MDVQRADLPQSPSDDLREIVTGLLSVSPTSIDDIIRQSGGGAAAVSGVILELELAGRLIRQRGQFVSLAPS